MVYIVYGFFGTFVCLFSIQDKNQVVVPLVMPKGRGLSDPNFDDYT
jgi:hypothetical protein